MIYIQNIITYRWLQRVEFRWNGDVFASYEEHTYILLGPTALPPSGPGPPHSRIF